MTSQKSLKNNVNKNDFKRSLMGSLLFPMIAFLVLFFMVTCPIIDYVTADDFVRALEHTEVSMFLSPHSTFYYAFDLLPVGMVICGMLTAIKSFWFLFSKKQVNVYLSLGVKRNTMFTNRLISGVVLLFAAVFVPILIIYIINIVNFGMSAHITKLFIYFVLALFVCGLTGFSIVSAMTMVSGNVVEAGVSSAALSVIPLCIFSTIFALANGYLKGYTRVLDHTRILSLFTPWTMVVNMKEEYLNYYYLGEYDYSDLITPSIILRLLQRTVPADEYKIPAEYSVDWGFIFPLVMWFVISVALIGVAYYLFNKRNAEHANSLGKFSVLRAVMGTCAGTAITWILAEWLRRECNISVYFVITTVTVLLAYFLVQLILSRKPKTALKSMKWSYVLVGALAVTTILINTGFLGTYNKIPDVKDVKSVTMEAYELSSFAHWVYPWENDENYVESSTDESKEMTLKVYELLKDEKVKYGEDSLTTVTFGMRDNEGDIKFRKFEIFSEEIYMKYVQLVYGSDYFDAVLKNYLVDDASNNTLHDSTGYLQTFDWAYTDKDMIININEDLEYIDNVDGLCEALYKDISKMSVDELFKNNNQPLGILANASRDADYPGYTATYYNSPYHPMSTKSDYEYVGDKAIEGPDYNHSLIDCYIPVHENMTNTIKFLKDNGYELKTEPMKVVEVLYTDSPISLDNAKHEFGKVNEDINRSWGSYNEIFPKFRNTMFRQTDVTFYCNEYLEYYISEPMTEYDLINMVYKDSGHPLTSVKDGDKAQEIVDKTVSQYLTVNDNGRYVYVIYDSGVMACYYLPEANVSVLK